MSVIPQGKPAYDTEGIQNLLYCTPLFAYHLV